MARTKITRSNIADNAVGSEQILNSSIKKEDINISSPNNAIVTKVIAGTNISISSTGVDTGTGDVTINVSAIPAAVDYQLEGSLIAQHAKLNITDSNEINFTLVDDVANSRVNLTANINSIDYLKITNTPTDVATQTNLTNHINDTTKHLTSTQNTWIDAITVSSIEVNHLTNVSSNIQTQLNNKEGSLTAGSSSQYYRGDKTWQILDKTAVGLSNVENTALSSWTGSTNLTTAGALTVTGSILPSLTQTYDIGSPSLRFKAIYVDEAHLAVNTLYIGDTAILGTSAQTVNIHADPNQSIDIQTSGTGTTTLESAKAITVSTSGINADVFMNATGSGSNVRIGATNELQVNVANAVLSCPVTANSLTVTNNLTVGGNLVVNGTTSTINTTNTTIRDNIISLNYGEIGSGVTSGLSGFQVDRGDLSDYQLLFDESDDFFKIGAVGSLEIIATRPWIISNYSTSSHTHSLDGLSNITVSNKQTNDLLKWNGTAWVNSVIDKSFVGLSNVDNTSDVNKPVSTAQQTALDLKANLASPTFTGTVGGITKAMVGLSNVDNTTDAAKPVSTAQQTALDLKANLASPTFTGTVTLAEGTSAAPSLSFTNDGAPDTGFYHISDGSFGVTCNTIPTVQFTGSNTKFNTQIECSNIYKSGGTAPAYYMSQDGTGRQHWYWNTAGGTSPTFAVAGEDACDLMHTVANDGSGGYFQFKTASGLNKAAGAAISWTEVLFAHSSRFSYMGNTVWHSGNDGAGSGLDADTLDGMQASSFAPAITNGNVTSGTLTTSTTAANQVLATVSATTYRTVKAIISATSGISYHATELLITHDGTTASIVEYSPNYTGVSLFTIDADISSGNLRILVTPVNAVTTIKTILTLVNA